MELSAKHSNDATLTRSRFAPFSLIFAIVSAAGVAVIGVVALSLIAENLKKSPDMAAQMPGFARWIVDHRGWLPLACLPPIVVAVRPLVKRSSATARWTGFIIAESWAVILFGLVLYTFIASLAPAYQYQPLD